ncbi:SdiA-regulated domain-containing protein [Flammeovirga pacifica]|uniref:Phytase-like domain-containing protein n=1 Tax=Flammeovirga pacifica TaxID=915059 RepID=A0A1S1Z377_FLAPC|nr:SdiA-regulated domain-containing protein [Flammeovirga pacifica]OHX67729.1 hypothetical protein NH26_15960 [Flammeovirga pacifica]
MKKGLMIFLFKVLILSSLNINAQKIKELKLLEIKQLTNYKDRFDLSGISNYKNDFVVVGDKFENKFIYTVVQKENNFELISSYPLSIEGKLDLEGISVYDQKAYLINEANNEVYVYDFDNHTTTMLPIDWSNLSLPKDEWLKNTGFEGVAVDHKSNLLYLAKERQPSFILVVDLLTNKIIKEINIKKSCSKDISDICLYNGDLFILERNAQCIGQYSLSLNKIVRHYSYKKSVIIDGEKLYEPEKYGMAEALLIKDGSLWLGFDNNGVNTSKNATQKYGINGTKPVILKFEFNL